MLAVRLALNASMHQVRAARCGAPISTGAGGTLIRYNRNGGKQRTSADIQQQANASHNNIRPFHEQWRGTLGMDCEIDHYS